MSAAANTTTKNPHHTEEDYLEVDTPVPGQNFVCLSFVSPEKTLVNKEKWMFYQYHQYVISEYNKIFSELTDKILESGDDQVSVAALIDVKKRMKRVFDANQVEYTKWTELTEDFNFREGETLGRKFDEMNNFQTSVRGVKVRGVYDSYKEAEIRSKFLQRSDSKFDVFIGQVGYWLPWHPDVNKINDQEHMNDELNTLMKEYKANEGKRDMFFQEQTRQRTQEAKDQVARMKEQLAVESASANTPSATPATPATLTEAMAPLTDVDPWMQRKMEDAAAKQSGTGQ
jgi:hypothetical protein